MCVFPVSNSVSQGLGVYSVQRDFKSSIRYFVTKIGTFMGIKYTLFSQILAFRMNLFEGQVWV